uniref:Uncharacterized protein n=1 Tax=Palpitomonas bilix TaxID=652834 RepID=A0A7S3GAN6_9EUKA|mmetsp:Transcript_40768/g.105786  ORF Transcript_40768/g.105786 Transcript_40768/m.105786 type:complete len:175 (+) Transcript_40768:153-677(+)
MGILPLNMTSGAKHNHYYPDASGRDTYIARETRSLDGAGRHYDATDKSATKYGGHVPGSTASELPQGTIKPGTVAAPDYNEARPKITLRQPELTSSLFGLSIDMTGSMSASQIPKVEEEGEKEPYVAREFKTTTATFYGERKDVAGNELKNTRSLDTHTIAGYSGFKPTYPVNS